MIENCPARSLAKNDATSPATFTYIFGGNYSAVDGGYSPSYPAWLQGVAVYLVSNGSFDVYNDNGGVSLTGFGVSMWDSASSGMVLNLNHEFISRAGVTVVDMDHKYRDKNNVKILDIQQAGVTHPNVGTVTTIAEANTAIQTLQTKLNAALDRLEAHGLIATGGH